MKKLGELLVEQGRISERDVETPIYLPDLPDTPTSASATLTAGTQGAPTTLTSAGGSDLVIAAGVSVGTPDAAATIDVRLGEVSPGHVPGDLPAPTSQIAATKPRVDSVEGIGRTSIQRGHCARLNISTESGTKTRGAISALELER